MKILVFSDSHRDIEGMVTVSKKLKPDMVLHLGDHADDGVELDRRIGDIPVVIVKGNCDLWTAVASEKMLDLDGLRIFMTHGNQYGVRNGYSTIIKEGRKRKADVILCGHTHIPRIIKNKDLYLMNPGKAGKNARGPFKASFGVITTGENLVCRIEKIADFIQIKA